MSTVPSHTQAPTGTRGQPFTPWCKSCWDSLSPDTQLDLDSVTCEYDYGGHLLMPHVDEHPELIIAQCSSHASTVSSKLRQHFTDLSTELRGKYPEKWPQGDKEVWDMLKRVEADRQAETDENKGSTRTKYLYDFTTDQKDHESLVGIFGCYRGLCEDGHLLRQSLPFKVISLAPSVASTEA